MEQNSIVVKNVTKKFDDFMLDHISFTVPTGRIVGFIGENGAGKSTTINLILDQLKLDAGEIRILAWNFLVKSVIIGWMCQPFTKLKIPHEWSPEKIYEIILKESVSSFV